MDAAEIQKRLSDAKTAANNLLVLKEADEYAKTWSDAAREAAAESRREHSRGRSVERAAAASDRKTKSPVSFNVDPKTGPTKEQMAHAALMMGKKPK